MQSLNDMPISTHLARHGRTSTISAGFGPFAAVFHIHFADPRTHNNAKKN